MKTQKILLLILLLFCFSCKKDKVLPYPSQGLISYFNFDDNLIDVKGYAKNGEGNATFTTGKIGKAATLNGTDQKIIFSTNTSSDLNSISFVFWFKTNESSTTKILLKSSIWAFSTGSGKVYFSLTPGATKSVQYSYLISEWVHVVGTYNGTDMVIYINGELQATTNASGYTGFNTQFYYGFDGLSTYWAGSIDELYIYNRALSQAEVTQLYNLK